MNSVMVAERSMPDVATDYDKLATIGGIAKSSLVDAAGRTYKEFKCTLKPRWSVVWRELSAGYLVLLATATIAINLEDIALGLPITIILCAIIFGYTQAYIQLFFHEASHGNIAKNRKLNDFLANILIGIFVAQDIKAYRVVHFKHHQKLGTTADTERTYFDPLNWRFIIESLTGMRVFKVLYGRRVWRLTAVPEKQKKHKSPFINIHVLRSVSLHAFIVIGAFVTGHWPLAVAWLLGMGVVFPFFGAVRQVLEHRDIHASSESDYRIVTHGPVNRLFGDGFLSRTLGGAGFNRHLLHHIEPQISYTRLREFEEYLLQTQVAGYIRNHQTTYTETFMQLMRSS